MQKNYRHTDVVWWSKYECEDVPGRALKLQRLPPFLPPSLNFVVQGTSLPPFLWHNQTIEQDRKKLAITNHLI
jgi:hypothetical protein